MEDGPMSDDTPSVRRDPTAIHHVERILAVMAHPDDVDVRCAGTFAKWVAEGKAISYVVVTSGERGGDGSLPEQEVGEIREAEQRAAATVVGARDVVFLHQEDGYLVPSMELRKLITREIRRFRPEVVVMHNPIRHYGWGNHPDHFAVGEATAAAVYPTARNPMVFPDLLDEGFAPWEVTWTMAIDAETPDHFVDIGSSLQRKLEAVGSHRSQYGEHYLQFNQRIAEQTARQALAAGYPPMEYAEAFKLRFEGHPRTAAALRGMVPG
jgi:LmbE family N-acetylglucosaminyl deacetylase